MKNGMISVSIFKQIPPWPGIFDDCLIYILVNNTKRCRYVGVIVGPGVDGAQKISEIYFLN